MPGESVITIPTEMVPLVRDGAYFDLSTQINEVDEEIESRVRRNISAGVDGGLARASGARALLDIVGWTDPVDGEPEVIDVDAREHRGALLRALQTRRGIEQGVAKDSEASTVERAEAKSRAAQLGELLARVKRAPNRIDELAQVRPGEHLVLLQLLSGAGGRPRWQAVAAIERALDDLDPVGVRSAIDGLVAEGVAVRDGESLRASRCALHIDRMGVICV